MGSHLYRCSVETNQSRTAHLENSPTREKVVIKLPESVGKTVTPFEICLPWEISPPASERWLAVARLIIFVLSAAVSLFALLHQTPIDEAPGAGTLSKAAFYLLMAFTLCGSLVFLMGIANTLPLLFAADTPVLTIDKDGFCDRRVAARKILWKSVEPVKVLHGRGGVIGVKLRLMDGYTLRFRPLHSDLLFDQLRMPFRRRTGFVVSSVGLGPNSAEIAHSLYSLALGEGKAAEASII